MKTLFLLFVIIIGIKDYISYYFSSWWIVPALFFLGVQIYVLGLHTLSFSCSFFYGVMAYLFYRKEWMGIADVYFLSYFGLLLGWSFMIEVHFISVLAGFLFSWIKKETYIPYISCLSIGILLVYFKTLFF